MYVNQAVNPPLNQNQGPTIAKISAEPRTKDSNVAIITHGGVTAGDDSPFPRIWFDWKKKVQFDVDAERDTFFEAHNAIGRNPGKFHIYEMPIAFDSTSILGPS